MEDINPGPWQEIDGIYFEFEGKQYGPYQDEEAAEWDLDRVRHGQLPPMEELDVPADSCSSRSGHSWTYTGTT